MDQHHCRHGHHIRLTGARGHTSICWQQDFKPPSGDLANAIEKDFGSLDGLIGKFNPACAGIQVTDQLDLMQSNEMCGHTDELPSRQNFCSFMHRTNMP